jgi:hypothetical protein
MLVRLTEPGTIAEVAATDGARPDTSTDRVSLAAVSVLG